MSKFAEWMKSNDKKQRGVAKKLGISTSTLNSILKNGQVPKLHLAYKIELYTQGAVTMYDWLDDPYEKEDAERIWHRLDT